MEKVQDSLKLKLRQVNMPDVIWERIREIASLRKVSMSEICRKAIINFLKKEGNK